MCNPVILSVIPNADLAFVSVLVLVFAVAFAFPFSLEFEM
jgi:hypothetical protein